MIKFFRKIRQRLLSENKFSKYLIYALGEIVLVVFGILIALQINNWNEDRKLKSLELETLKELQSAFESDLNDIETNLEIHESSLNACVRLLAAFDQELPYHDSLDVHFGKFYLISVFINSTSAYEMLKSRGLDIISNDSLRKQVVAVHDNIYHYIKLNESGGDMLDLRENRSFIFEHMTDWKFFESVKPRDYNSLSKDPVFRNRLEYTLQARRMSIASYGWAKKQCQVVADHLEQEISKISSEQ